MEFVVSLTCLTSLEKSFTESAAPAEIRTIDLLFFSQEHYRLNYLAPTRVRGVLFQHFVHDVAVYDPALELRESLGEFLDHNGRRTRRSRIRLFRDMLGV
ncbi:hypothetical protein EGW08_008100 [Elysia chlorotica]|uniref:Uncharacterized protein n=1 Tax=Elysia chlorotica TaxID=188477 RepID=A0A3S1BI07_ELYCH|nr:hypothetical protein EGW08_008100 [Elysia chlorotica]